MSVSLGKSSQFNVTERLRQPTVFAPLLAMAGFVLCWYLIHHGVWTQGKMLDTPIYAGYAQHMKDGQLPYRDFVETYPPLALPIFLIPGLVAGQSFGGYAEVFEAIMLICGLGAVGLASYMVAEMGVTGKRLYAVIGLGGLTPLLIGSVILSRYDLWPTLLTLAALAGLYYDMPRTGFAFLALGTAAKAYPMFLVPLALIFVWRSVGWRAALESLGVFAALLLVICLPFAILAPHGFWASINSQTGRPLQIESLGATIWLFAHQVLGTHLHIYFTHGSDNLDGHASLQFGTVMSVLQIGAILGIYAVYGLGQATRERLLMTSAAVVCAFIVFDRVLSPQYLLWLVPMVMLVVNQRRGLLAVGLLAASMALTQIWFPHHFVGLKHFQAFESWGVIARDLVLLALFGTLAWPDVPVWSSVKALVRRGRSSLAMRRLPHLEEA
jgi:hypothetical protein